MNWDYVAGFFDGEGSVLVRTAGRKAVALSFANTNREVIEAIQEFLQVARVHTHRPNTTRKSYFELRPQDHRVCLQIARQLVPRCIVKRNDLLNLIRFVERNEWAKRGEDYRWHRELDQAKLQQLYLERRLSIYQIAEMHDCSFSAVRKRLIKFGIPIRTPREGVLNALEKGIIRRGRDGRITRNKR